MSRHDDGGNDPCSLGDGKVLRDSGKAILFKPHDDKEFWVPSSVVHDDSPVWDDDENSEGELIVKQWWAEKEQRY